MSDAPKPQHKEAFALMWYGCKCGHRERIWNSRDGVTPFCCGCPSCGQVSLQHIDWARDLPAAWHLPHKGQRVWRNGLPDEAADFMTKRIASSRNAGYEIDQEEADRLVRSARDGGEDSEFRAGWPALVVVVEKGKVPGAPA